MCSSSEAHKRDFGAGKNAELTHAHSSNDRSKGFDCPQSGVHTYGYTWNAEITDYPSKNGSISAENSDVKAGNVKNQDSCVTGTSLARPSYAAACIADPPPGDKSLSDVDSGGNKQEEPFADKTSNSPKTIGRPKGSRDSRPRKRKSCLPHQDQQPGKATVSQERERDRSTSNGEQHNQESGDYQLGRKSSNFFDSHPLAKGTAHASIHPSSNRTSHVDNIILTSSIPVPYNVAANARPAAMSNHARLFDSEEGLLLLGGDPTVFSGDGGNRRQDPFPTRLEHLQRHQVYGIGHLAATRNDPLYTFEMSALAIGTHQYQDADRHSVASQRRDPVMQHQNGPMAVHVTRTQHPYNSSNARMVHGEFHTAESSQGTQHPYNPSKADPYNPSNARMIQREFHTAESSHVTQHPYNPSNADPYNPSNARMVQAEFHTAESSAAMSNPWPGLHNTTTLSVTSAPNADSNWEQVAHSPQEVGYNAVRHNHRAAVAWPPQPAHPQAARIAPWTPVPEAAAPTTTVAAANHVNGILSYSASKRPSDTLAPPPAAMTGDLCNAAHGAVAPLQHAGADGGGNGRQEGHAQPAATVVVAATTLREIDPFHDDWPAW